MRSRNGFSLSSGHRINHKHLKINQKSFSRKFSSKKRRILGPFKKKSQSLRYLVGNVCTEFVLIYSPRSIFPKTKKKYKRERNLNRFRVHIFEKRILSGDTYTHRLPFVRVCVFMIYRPTVTNQLRGDA